MLNLYLFLCFSRAGGRGSLWSVVWWRFCWWSQHQVIALTAVWFKKKNCSIYVYSKCFSQIRQLLPIHSHFSVWVWVKPRRPDQMCHHAVIFLLRCTSPRGYRLPPCALINLSHGARVDHTSHKLTAIVKPQPATGANFSSHRQLAGLNHSPRSPFIPMQVRDNTTTSRWLSPVWNDKTVKNVAS